MKTGWQQIVPPYSSHKLWIVFNEDKCIRSAGTGETGICLPTH